MKVGDLVTFSSTGNKLLVVRESRKKMFKDLCAGGADRAKAFKKSDKYKFFGIVLSTRGVPESDLENMERHQYWYFKRAIEAGQKFLVMWSNAPKSGGGIKKGRDSYYYYSGYSLWKRGDLKKVKLNKKKK